MVPGTVVLGTPGALGPPGFKPVLEPVPVPLPVVVVDDPPGAGEMPAEPGFCVPTGGTVPVPGAVPTPAAPAPAPCARASLVVCPIAPIRDIATSAVSCSLCR